MFVNLLAWERQAVMCPNCWFTIHLSLGGCSSIPASSLQSPVYHPHCWWDQTCHVSPWRYLRRHLLRSPSAHSKKCVIPGLRKTDSTWTCFRCVPWEGPLTLALGGFSLAHQLDPEVGNEKEQQQSHRQEDAREQEPAWKLSQELWQHRAHCQSHRSPTRASGVCTPGWGQLTLEATLFSSGVLAFAQHRLGFCGLCSI